MSLTQTIYNYIKKHVGIEKSLQLLRATLMLIQERSLDCYNIKDVYIAINRLIKLILANANTIFYIINTILKVNLYKNFQPRIITCNKAYYATKILTISLFSFYNLDAQIYISNYKQIQPIVLFINYKKEYYKVQFQNTFYQQLLLLFIYRILTIKYLVSFLAKQY